MKNVTLHSWLFRKKHNFYVALLGSFFVLGSFATQAQTPAEFWGAFDKCTTILGIQSHYTITSPGASFNHNVMDHGVTIPSISGLTFLSNSNYNVVDKNAMTTGGYTDFFVINTYDISSTHAVLDFAYYYNFSGGYNHFVKALVVLDKVNGVWVISQSTIQ